MTALRASLLAGVYASAFVGADGSGSLPSGIGENLTLRIIPPSTADQYGSKCLDGTPPGYYYRLGDPTKWRLHLRGGAWCFSIADCASRAQSDLGSSAYFLPNFTDTPNIAEGFMGQNTDNYFGNWSFAFVQYCDGASWTSNNANPVPAPDGTSLWFRGSNNIDAIMADLESTFGAVSQATDFVLSGTSAGGLATILTADRWHGLLRNETKFAAVVDSGFFLNYSQYGNGVPAFAESFQSAVGPNLWNASSGTVQSCIQAFNNNPNTVWQCFFAEIAYGYTPADTKYFLVESQVDAWSVGNILALPCTPDIVTVASAASSSARAAGVVPPLSSCNASETAALQGYASATIERMVAAFQAKALRSPGSINPDGVYMTSCFQHGATCSDQDWLLQNINGASAGDVVAAWYTDPEQKGVFVQDQPFPGDNTCQYSATHGWC